MLRNLTLGLLEHGRIKTTIARAKRLRPFVERIVTRLKDPSVANRRLALSALGNKGAVSDIADKISPQFKDRPGGYLRILRLAKVRAGDCADMALIEWVEESLVPAYSQKAPKKAAGKGKKAPAKKAKSKKDDVEDAEVTEVAPKATKAKKTKE